METITLTTHGDRDIVITRRFQAPPEMVYRAHTQAALLQQWVLGPEGWSMPVCISQPQPGGHIRFEWTDGKGGDFYLTGEYLELQPNQRMVHVERMHLPDPTPDNLVETLFEKDGAGTLLRMRMTLPDPQTRDTMLAEGMAHGMEVSYQRLDRLLANQPAHLPN